MVEIVKITEKEFRQMVSVSSRKLSRNAEFINSLNVFPVPDGDTGTNMSLTLASGEKYVNQDSATSIETLANSLAKGLLMGARGNSGVILSQIFRGFSKDVVGKSELDATDLAHALSAGVKAAYKAVMKPTEGTILTVSRKAAEEALKVAKEGGSVVEVMVAAAQAADEALQTTPDLLPVLKEVGVVDSGGQGLTFVYQGFADALTGNVSEDDQHTPTMAEMDEMVNAQHHQSVQGQLNTEDIVFGYCTEIMVRLGAGRLVTHDEFNYEAFHNALAEIGDSLLVIADDEIVKVHVHTEHPGTVMELGQSYGSLIKVKVDNMRLQHETILEHDKEEAKKEPKVNKELTGDYGVIAVSSGTGMAELFTSLGVTKVLSGGQTMNPSTQDIVDAIQETGAKKVLVLPNNKNIFMAANQAAEVSEVDVAVVETRTVLQGMTAMLGFDKDADLEENKETMTEEMADVVSGQVTIAVRDTTIDGQEIKKDDYMGIIDGKIKVTNPDRKQAAIDMVKAMLNDDSEIVTIIVGEDGTQAEAAEIEDAILAIDEDLEVEIHQGDQPVYPYLVAVE